MPRVSVGQEAGFLPASDLRMHTLYLANRDARPFMEQDRRRIEAILSDHFASFTLFDAMGFWQGSTLPTMLIKVATPSGRDVVEAGHRLRLAFGQEAVGWEHDGHYARLTAGLVAGAERGQEHGPSTA